LGEIIRKLDIVNYWGLYMHKTIMASLNLLITTFILGQNAEDLNKKSKVFILKDDFQNAVPLIKEAAEKGNAEAQCNYGICFQKGIIVQRNDSIAFYWFLKSANQGWPNGQLHVGSFYMENTFLKPDFNKAFEWIKKCAFQGDVECMWSLSSGYEYGTGIKEDIDSMLYWQIAVAKLHTSAVDNDDKRKVVQARINLAEWYKEGYKRIAKDNVKSYMWFLLYNEDKKHILGLGTEENQKAQERNIDTIKDLEKLLTNDEKQKAAKSAEEVIQHKLINLNYLYTIDQ